MRKRECERERERKKERDYERERDRERDRVINRQAKIRPTMFSPSSPTTTTGGAPLVVPTPNIPSTSVE